MNAINNMKKHNKLLNLLINCKKKSLQGNLFDKNEYESLCNVITKYLVDAKIETFL